VTIIFNGGEKYRLQELEDMHPRHIQQDSVTTKIFFFLSAIHANIYKLRHLTVKYKQENL